MKNKDRILIYLVGFVIGTIFVSAILSRRAVKEKEIPDSFLVHNERLITGSAEPLPVGMPESLYKGKIIDFGYLNNNKSTAERVWLLNFNKSYPFVRVVEDMATKEFKYMAADQITIILAQGVDVTELKPMLDKLGLRLRMFNRKERLAVIGVVNKRIDSVPATIQAVQPWSKLFVTARADILHFQPNSP